MQNQKLLNNLNFKNNGNYIFGKKEKQKIFFLFKFYKNKKFLIDFFETKSIFYFFSILSGIFPFSLFASLIVKKINVSINNLYYILFSFYFIISFYIYFFFIKKAFQKINGIYILKKNKNKIFLDKYFEPKKIDFSLKEKILTLIEKNYIILSVNKTKNKIFFKEE